MDKERISYHESVQKMYERIKADNMTNVWDRYEAQGIGGGVPDRRCTFCMAGAAVTCVLMVPAVRTLQKTKEGGFAGSLPTEWQ